MSLAALSKSQGAKEQTPIAPPTTFSLKDPSCRQLLTMRSKCDQIPDPHIQSTDAMLSRKTFYSS